MHDTQDFNLLIPIEKSQVDCEKGTGDWFISGPLSSSRLDLQGEIVLLDALKAGLDTHKRMGMPVDYDHQSVKKGDLSYIIGKGVGTFEGPAADGGQTVHLRTRIFGGKPLAKQIKEHVESGGDLFYSIGGTAERDGKLIKKTNITHIAVTPYPANPDARVGVESLAKSLYGGDVPTADVEIVPTDTPASEAPAQKIEVYLRDANGTLIGKGASEVNKAMTAGAGSGLQSTGGRALVGEDLEGDEKNVADRAVPVKKDKKTAPTRPKVKKVQKNASSMPGVKCDYLPGTAAPSGPGAKKGKGFKKAPTGARVKKAKTVVKSFPLLGSGERFKKLKGKLSHEDGVDDPGALAAKIGRDKYGKKKFGKLAAKGHKMSKDILEGLDETQLEELQSMTEDEDPKVSALAKAFSGLLSLFKKNEEAEDEDEEEDEDGEYEEDDSDEDEDGEDEEANKSYHAFDVELPDGVVAMSADDLASEIRKSIQDEGRRTRDLVKKYEARIKTLEKSQLATHNLLKSAVGEADEAGRSPQRQTNNGNSAMFKSADGQEYDKASIQTLLNKAVREGRVDPFEASMFSVQGIIDPDTLKSLTAGN